MQIEVCGYCACSALLQAGGQLDGRASEKGLLQLLFDVRYLSDALSGGRPLGDPQPDTHPALPSSRCAQVSGHMKPSYSLKVCEGQVLVVRVAHMWSPRCLAFSNDAPRSVADTLVDCC